MEKGGYQSGQMGQTVTLLSQDFEGSNPSPPTKKPFSGNWKAFCFLRSQTTTSDSLSIKLSIVSTLLNLTV